MHSADELNSARRPRRSPATDRMGILQQPTTPVTTIRNPRQNLLMPKKLMPIRRSNFSLQFHTPDVIFTGVNECKDVTNIYRYVKFYRSFTE